MTQHKHLKRRIRERMAETGEASTVPRRVIVSPSAPKTVAQGSGAVGDAAPSAPHPLPGVHPLTSVLRTLLVHAGVEGHGGELPSEALVLGIGGGLGMGVFAFHYVKEDFQNLYLAGRHLWQDNVQWMRDACDRFGVRPTFHETGSAKQAQAQLAEALARSPAAAWVDKAPLRYHGFPQALSGAGYHVLVVHGLDGEAGQESAIIGDLADGPYTVPVETLAAARGRIRKNKHRLLTLARHGRYDLKEAVQSGLAAGYAGLATGKMRNFTLAALEDWAKRIHGAKGKESWATVFPRGRGLWRGLRCIHDSVELDGTGGGLLRPLFADFLEEAAALLERPALSALAGRYRDLGGQWSALAEAALPQSVPALHQTRERMDELRRMVLEGSAAPAEIEQIEARRAELDALGEAMREGFPLDEQDTAALLLELQERVRMLHHAEVEAHAAWGAAL